MVAGSDSHMILYIFHLQDSAIWKQILKIMYCKLMKMRKEKQKNSSHQPYLIISADQKKKYLRNCVGTISIPSTCHAASMLKEKTQQNSVRTTLLQNTEYVQKEEKIKYQRFYTIHVQIQEILEDIQYLRMTK